MIARIKKRLLRICAGLRRDDGATAVEFVLMLPLFLMVFMASFESGLLMTRSIMLEQSVDMTMRELRLGHFTLPATAAGKATFLKAEICNRTVIFKDCNANITIEMTRVSTTTFIMPTARIQCKDRVQNIEPTLTLTIGQKDDVMLVRVCVVQDMLFPGVGLGLSMPRVNSNDRNGYGVIATTAFLTEPA